MTDCAQSEKLIARYENAVTPAMFRSTDLTFLRGEGVHLFDADGKKYIDFTAGIAVMAVGHCHPEVVAAISKQANTLLHAHAIVGVMEPYVCLMERLKSIAPGELKDGKGIFVNSGSEAVDAGLKLARYATNRPMIIAFEHAFHGRTMGAVAATASVANYRRRLSGLLGGVHHAVYPTPHAPFGTTLEEKGRIALQLLEEALQTAVSPEDVAGILVEPIMGEGGYYVPPAGFLEGLRALCDRYGFLLIFDEVQTGGGRTGRWFAAEHWNVVPDIALMGKPIGGGLPLGAVLARKHVAEAWAPGSHGSTFGGNPVACQAGLAVFDIIEKQGLRDNAHKVGEHIQMRFKDAKRDIPAIHDIRGKGLMVGVEIVNPKTGELASSQIRDIAKAIGHAGVVITKCGASTLRICPPLTLTAKDADRGVDIILEVLREAF